MLLRLSSGFSSGYVSLLSLIHNYKEKENRDEADAKIHGYALPPISERLKYFDDISAIIMKMLKND